MLIEECYFAESRDSRRAAAAAAAARAASAAAAAAAKKESSRDRSDMNDESLHLNKRSSDGTTSSAGNIFENAKEAAAVHVVHTVATDFVSKPAPIKKQELAQVEVSYASSDSDSEVDEEKVPEVKKAELLSAWLMPGADPPESATPRDIWPSPSRHGEHLVALHSFRQT